MNIAVNINTSIASGTIPVPKQVLVVDDEADLCLLYETTLKRAGYDVYTAEGVQAAKKIL